MIMPAEMNPARKVRRTAEQTIWWGIIASIGAYFLSISGGLDPASIAAAFQDPHSADWAAAGEQTVNIGLRFQQDVTALIEGPVNDFVMSVKDSMIENSDRFAPNIPDYSFDQASASYY